MMQRSIRNLIICAFFLLSLPAFSAEFPDAPSSIERETEITAAPRPTMAVRAIESNRAYHVSQGLLIASTAWDAVATARALTHPTHLTGSYYYVPTGVWVYPNVDLTRYYSEHGWAKFFGPRNATGVVIANVGVSAGVLLLSHELAKRGPKWRAVATMLNSGRAAGSFAGAVSWIGQSDYANSLPAKWGYPVTTLGWKP